MPKNLFDVFRAVDVMATGFDNSLPTPVPSSAATESRVRIEHLEERLDRLALINMAMWSLIRQHTQLTEEDLIERVQEIDLLDGKADSRVSRQVGRCPACKRVMAQRHTKCLYCGEARPVLTAFDTVV
jgi:hypothetical protein